MRPFLALLPLVLVLAGCASVSDTSPADQFQLPDPPTTDATLQGKWKLVRFERFGGPCESDSVGKIFEITDKQVIAPEKARFSVEGTYRVRPVEWPKQIDIKTAGCPKKPGIYSVDGNTLRLCINDNSSERPTTLASQGKSEIWLFVFERVKPVENAAK